MDLHRALHHDGRQDVVGDVLGDHGDDDGDDGERRAHKEGKKDGEQTRDHRPDDGHEVHDKGERAQKRRVGVTRHGKARRHHEAVGHRGDERAEHIAARRAREHGEHERDVSAVAGADDGGELAGHERVVLGDPVREHEAEKHRGEVRDQARDVLYKAARDLAGKVAGHRGTHGRQRSHDLVDSVLDVRVGRLAVGVPELREGLLRLVDIGRRVAQKDEELAHERSADHAEQQGDAEDKEHERYQGRDAARDLAVLEAVGDGAAHEAGDAADEDELERLPDEAERADNEPRRDEDPNHRPHGEHAGPPALGALKASPGELLGVFVKGAHRMSPSGSILSWMRRRARRSMRETCTCEMPSLFAISTCVMPSMKRMRIAC